MKVFYWTEPFKMEVGEEPMPVVSAGKAIIKIEYNGIC